MRRGTTIGLTSLFLIAVVLVAAQELRDPFVFGPRDDVAPPTKASWRLKSRPA